MASEKNYKQLREELDSILAWFSEDSVDIDEAATKYQQGIKVIKQLETYLKTAENKITRLKKSFEK